LKILPLGWTGGGKFEFGVNNDVEDFCDNCFAILKIFISTSVVSFDAFDKLLIVSIACPKNRTLKQEINHRIFQNLPFS
jgi:hypothetical protein